MNLYPGCCLTQTAKTDKPLLYRVRYWEFRNIEKTCGSLSILGLVDNFGDHYEEKIQILPLRRLYNSLKVRK